tara:strand:- start:106 stop:1197 length:1092 start_codon:yes stop_codon:yes gene_type:complete
MDKISWWRIHFGDEEINNVTSAIKNENLSQGEIAEKFEKNICSILNTEHVTVTLSGSIALLMSLIVIGIKPGDEVIIPNRTWIATANAALLLGAKVVLVDVEENKPIIDVNRIEENITKNTKAIIPVHINGRDANLEKVVKIAKKNHLYVIEDAAQALYSRNKSGYLGCQSFCGCFSMSLAKIISTGQGGFIISSDKETYNKLQFMRTHGVSNLVDAKFDNFGFNFRFPDTLASIGLAQLNRLKEHVERTKTIYDQYLSGLDDLDDLKLIKVNTEIGEVPIYNEILVNERVKLIDYLAKNGIETRQFYPNIGSASYIKNNMNYPNSDKFANDGVYLPSGPGQTDDNIQRVIDCIRSFYKGGLI